MTGDLMSIAQFGFAAVMAYLLWCSYRDIIPRLLTVIEQNSRALANVTAAMQQVIESQREIATALAQTNTRLQVLDERHERLVRECPFGADGLLRTSEKQGG